MDEIIPHYRECCLTEADRLGLDRQDLLLDLGWTPDDLQAEMLRRGVATYQRICEESRTKIYVCPTCQGFGKDSDFDACPECDGARVVDEATYSRWVALRETGPEEEAETALTAPLWRWVGIVGAVTVLELLDTSACAYRAGTLLGVYVELVRLTVDLRLSGGEPLECLSAVAHDARAAVNAFGKSLEAWEEADPEAEAPPSSPWRFDDRIARSSRHGQAACRGCGGLIPVTVGECSDAVFSEALEKAGEGLCGACREKALEEAAAGESAEARSARAKRDREDLWP